MKKEDYMKLSKKRLAELLEERDINDMQRNSISIPTVQVPTYEPPCYAPDGICVNPFHDCINCPKMYGKVGSSSAMYVDGTGTVETRMDQER